MTELTFIRHGQTDWNLQQRFQGHIDVPLNATGRQQASRLAARLASTPADLLYTSDLQRARQTAAPLAEAWGQTATPLAGLREQGFGVFEGLELTAVTTRHAALWASWLAHRGDFALPGGESLQQFSARVLVAVSELVDTHAGRRLAIVTHGGVLDVLWRSARQLPLDGARVCAIPNTGINRMRWQQGALVIETWGDDSHLHDPGQSAGNPP